MIKATGTLAVEDTRIGPMSVPVMYELTVKLSTQTETTLQLAGMTKQEIKNFVEQELHNRIEQGA